ncbi:hypothetical protein TNCV_1904051 [Trichonephila clavipes]|nr:hypothetical protein TNCV_1904051 [Trichonephila clavipes]
MRSMVSQRLTQITPPAATPDQLWQRVEAAWSAVSQERIQSLFKSMPRRVAAINSTVIGDEPRDFEPQSSDEDDTLTETPLSKLPYHATDFEPRQI